MDELHTASAATRAYHTSSVIEADSACAHLGLDLNICVAVAIVISQLTWTRERYGQAVIQGSSFNFDGTWNPSRTVAIVGTNFLAALHPQ